MEILVKIAPYALYMANTLGWLVILSIADDVLTGNKRRKHFITMGNITESPQLDLLTALYHYEAEEAEAEHEWDAFLRNLSYTNMLMTLCRETNENLRVRWAIDDLVRAAAITHHRLTDSQEPLIPYVKKYLKVQIYVHFIVEPDQITDNVAQLRVPPLPHEDSGIILARDSTVSCMRKLKDLLNDI